MSKPDATSRMRITALESLRRRVASRAAEDQHFKRLVSRIAGALGYDLRHLVRVVYQAECRQWIDALGPPGLDVLEISAGATWRDVPFRSYRAMDFPRYDICHDTLPERFDLIIADQVFEHLLWPYRAGRNVFAMLKPGGHFMVMTPFLVRIHEVPVDCSRWTETGIRHFLAECGFPLDDIRTGAWGNRAAAKANFVSWARVGWRRQFPNEPAYPLSVWALARKAAVTPSPDAPSPDAGDDAAA